jgi:hypothetical protein
MTSPEAILDGVPTDRREAGREGMREFTESKYLSVDWRDRSW